MYEFIDVNEVQQTSLLPVEAVSINDVFLEDVIGGYRTLYVTGRESLEKVFDSYEDTAADGTLTKRTKFPARTIIVGFQLLAKTPDEFREAFNSLNAALNVENAQIIFNDETDKFFIGSPIMNAEVTPGTCSVTGEYEIYCADPFKYSVDLHSPKPVISEDPETGLFQTFAISYDGTYPAYPEYIARFYNPDGETDEDNAELGQTETKKLLGDVGACKFVAFMDDENHVLQFGNPDLEDDPETPSPLMLTNRSFRKNGSYNPGTVGEEWVSPASGTSMLSPYQQQGALGTGAAIYGAAQATIEKNQVLLAATAGTNCTYTATVTRVRDRQSSRVKLDIYVKASKLKNSISKGASLTVEVTCGDSKATKILKSTRDAWGKGESRSCSFSMWVNATSGQTEVSGIKIRVVRANGSYKSGSSTVTATGSTGKLSLKACRNILVPSYIPIPVDSYYVRPSSYGAAIAKKYTGPTLTWTYPSSGLPTTDDAKGAAIFDLTWEMKCCTGKTVNEVMQMGAFECLILTGDSMDANGVITNQKVLAGFQFKKTNKSTKGSVKLFMGNKTVHSSTKDTEISWEKGLLGNKNGFASCRITKDGTGKIGFQIGGLFKGKAKTFSDNTTSTKRAYKVVFGFYQYGAEPKLDWNGIRSAKLKKVYGETALEDEPFSATQTLVVNSAACTVQLDGVSQPGLGALGNDWEKMCLTPGINLISTAFSQRPESTSSVIRHCREEEPYQGLGAYTAESVEVTADEIDAKTYYTPIGTDPQGLYIVTGITTDTNGKKRVQTKSGQVFVETTVTAETYNADPTAYLVVESSAPTFEVSYREVFI